MRTARQGKAGTVVTTFPKPSSSWSHLDERNFMRCITLTYMTSTVLGVIIAIIIALILVGVFFAAKAIGQKRAISGLSAADKTLVKSQTKTASQPLTEAPAAPAEGEARTSAIRRPMLISDHRVVAAEDGVAETHYVTFSAPMGDVVDLVVPVKDAAPLTPGSKGILVYRGSRFITFIKAPDAALPGRSVISGQN
jgi:MFS superfamily sulfate permease-like transporter